ncbi:MAG: Trk system potassium transporter TrkA [Blautia sp.]|jgi:trk system potassium uptake protein TrkA
MQIIIAGCGKVGKTLAQQLDSEGHNITLIDISASRLQDATSAIDVMGVVGNGASFNVQSDAGVENADLFIAVTHSDELNLLCCLIAKKAGKCHTIARVRNPLYNKEINFVKEQLGISMIINPELAAANEIFRLLRFPSAIKIDTFTKGKVELLKFKIRPDLGISGWQVSDIASRLKCDVLICGVERDDQVTIPNGNFLLQCGDSVSIVASPREAAEFFRKIGVKTHQVRNTLIVGGGTIAFYLAKLLQGIHIPVRIIEQNWQRCETLSELLPDANIICGDGTSQELLHKEGLEQAESVVAITNLDEENILLALYAQKHSKAKTIAKVNRISFNDVIDSLDIGSIIYPKNITADYITQYVRGMQNSLGSNVETLYKILDNKAEALEFAIKDRSPVVDVPLMDLNLKENLLISCITRRGKIIIPRGQDRIQVGDTVIVVTTHPGLHDIRDILKK